MTTELTAHAGQLARSVGSPEMLVAVTTTSANAVAIKEREVYMLSSGAIYGLQVQLLSQSARTRSRKEAFVEESCRL